MDRVEMEGKDAEKGTETQLSTTLGRQKYDKNIGAIVFRGLLVEDIMVCERVAIWQQPWDYDEKSEAGKENIAFIFLINRSGFTCLLHVAQK